MRFAYADPPYLGCCGRYQHFHPDGKCWDDPETHRALLVRLQDEFPDGWALSLGTPTVVTYCRFVELPEDHRWGAWVKPFAAFKPNVNPAYAWEPVLFRGGRKRDRTQPTVRDWHSESITLKRGLTGAKPHGFAHWVKELLGATDADEMHDLFPGTGGVTEAWRQGHLLAASPRNTPLPVSEGGR